MCRTHAPAGRSVDDRLGVVRELASAVDAVHGAIWAGVDERPILSRQFLIGRHQSKLPPDHPHNESAWLLSHRRVLGERYVRSPGWAVAPGGSSTANKRRGGRARGSGWLRLGAWDF